MKSGGLQSLASRLLETSVRYYNYTVKTCSVDDIMKIKLCKILRDDDLLREDLFRALGLDDREVQADLFKSTTAEADFLELRSALFHLAETGELLDRGAALHKAEPLLTNILAATKKQEQAAKRAINPNRADALARVLIHGDPAQSVSKQDMEEMQQHALVSYQVLHSAGNALDVLLDGIRKIDQTIRRQGGPGGSRAWARAVVF